MKIFLLGTVIKTSVTLKAVKENLYQEVLETVVNGCSFETMEGSSHPVTICKELPLVESLVVAKLQSGWNYRYFVCSSSEAGCYWKN